MQINLRQALIEMIFRLQELDNKLGNADARRINLALAAGLETPELLSTALELTRAVDHRLNTILKPKDNQQVINEDPKI